MVRVTCPLVRSPRYCRGKRLALPTLAAGGSGMGTGGVEPLSIVYTSIEKPYSKSNANLTVKNVFYLGETHSVLEVY